MTRAGPRAEFSLSVRSLFPLLLFSFGRSSRAVRRNRASSRPERRPRDPFLKASHCHRPFHFILDGRAPPEAAPGLRWRLATGSGRARRCGELSRACPPQGPRFQGGTRSGVRRTLAFKFGEPNLGVEIEIEMNPGGHSPAEQGGATGGPERPGGAQRKDRTESIASPPVKT